MEKIHIMLLLIMQTGNVFYTFINSISILFMVFVTLNSTGGVSGATKPCRWTIFTLSRIIFSFAQFILFLYAGHQLYTNKPEYFADQSDSLGYTSRLILWVISLLALLSH